MNYRRAMRLLALILLALVSFAPTASAAPAPLVQPLERLSRAGNPEADYHLGMIYHLGLEGEVRDPQRAFRYFVRAAAAGHALGAYKLGCFFAGQGEGAVPPDPELALHNKLEAAEAGYDLAQFEVAQIYAERGDFDEAARWLEAAARQGSAQAAMALLMLHMPEGPKPDPVQAWLYRELARRDIGRMMASLPESERPSAAEMAAAIESMFPLQVTSAQQAQAQERLLRGGSSVRRSP